MNEFQSEIGYYKGECERQEISIQNNQDLYDKNEEMNQKMSNMHTQVKSMSEQNREFEVKASSAQKETEMKSREN